MHDPERRRAAASDRRCPQRQIGQVFRQRIHRGVRPERVNHKGQRISPDSRQVGLARPHDREGQTFGRGNELRVNAGSIASRIDAIPAVVGEPHRIETVKAPDSPFIVACQSLVTQSGRKPVRAQQRCQQMTLGVAEPTAFSQNLRRGTGDSLQAMVGRRREG